MIVLDTHVWLWWISDETRLSQRALAAIESAESIGVSAASCWEVATLQRIGRIALDVDVAGWVRRALAQERVMAVPITETDAVAAGQLPEGFGGDPADRMIFATALRLSALLVTRDERLRRFDPDRTIW
jgi:PIN domain nuclease of toxin-antitoxin system